MARTLRKCHGEKFYGSVNVTFFAGEVRRVVIESSHTDPDSLAPGGPSE